MMKKTVKNKVKSDKIMYVVYENQRTMVFNMETGLVDFSEPVKTVFSIGFRNFEMAAQYADAKNVAAANYKQDYKTGVLTYYTAEPLSEKLS